MVDIVRVTQLGVESLGVVGQTDLRVTQMGVESMGVVGPKDLRVTQMGVEIMVPIAPPDPTLDPGIHQITINILS